MVFVFKWYIVMFDYIRKKFVIDEIIEYLDMIYKDVVKIVV